MTTPPIRDAATLILVRDPDTAPRVLMGQRGAKAAFMPNKFVFPGGAVDADDALVPLLRDITEPCRTRLGEASDGPPAHALAAAAIRELWEEAGLIIGERARWDRAPQDWRDFASAGFRPSGHGLHYVFRAITPPGRPRRFDARFFVANADLVQGDLDDFSRATDELSHLQWIELHQAQSFNLPFITEVVLAEVAKSLPDIAAPASIPFFNNTDEQSMFQRLGGQSPLAR